jgi:transposase-like protein
MEAMVMARKQAVAVSAADRPESLVGLACPNPDCTDFNRFDAGNLAVAERTGKHKAIRRLYCRTCGRRFSERQGSLLEYTKLPTAAVVRIVKCLGHGCSIEATADICEVDPRSVGRVLAMAGPRAEHFHRLALQKLDQPLEVVELDELHARVCRGAGKKREAEPPADAPRDLRGLRAVAAWVGSGCTWPWRRSAGS